MAEVFPFRGIRYAPQKVSIEKVVTQPYDKISPEMQERYYALDPHNIIRIILGRKEPGDTPETNVYTRAAAAMREWRDSGILQPLSSPAFVVYFQRFTIPGTSDERLRKGFIGLGKLEDYSSNVIFPHERTLAGPKQDRLNLLRHTRTHFEQIFMLYDDPLQRIDRVLDDAAKSAPDIQVQDEYGVEHTLWIVDSRSVLEWIQGEMSGRQLIIADGHHRYETALAYRDELRRSSAGADPDAAFERMPMTFFNMASPGLTILPTHRVVSNLKEFIAGEFMRRSGEFFDVVESVQDPEQFRAALTQSGSERLTIGVSTDGGRRHALLRLRETSDLTQAMAGFGDKERSLDVVALHRLLIERYLGITEDAISRESHISYVREFDGALKAVARGRAQISFLLNPTRMDQLRDLAYAGKVMPQKSTDFYPKVLSGLLLYSLDAR